MPRARPPLRIESFAAQPVATIHYLSASPRGGTEVNRLVVEQAIVSGLPDEIDAVIATSDLQGIVPAPGDGEARLLGLVTAETLEELAFDGVLPAAPRTGVLLAGDLYSVPAANKRGGRGDVTEVWTAFAERFAWVAGVLGNHDDLGGSSAIARLCRSWPIHVLDGDVAVVDGLRIGGVSLVVGNPDKPGRRDHDDQLALIARVAGERLDLLVLHEGPHGGAHQPGHAEIRKVIERGRVPLTVSGHVHWEQPLAEHPHGQMLGVDARVVVLTRAPAS